MVSAPLSAISKDSKERLRLWIRMLRASRSIEAELRERLRQEFDTTLPRFDVMAALYRAPEGMLMSGLSRFLLVSNGNVTGIVDRLVSEGLVTRARRNGDRRTGQGGDQQREAAPHVVSLGRWGGPGQSPGRRGETPQPESQTRQPVDQRSAMDDGCR